MAPRDQYCAVSSTEHTGCLYTGVDEDVCDTTGLIRGLTDAQKDTILEFHNGIRSMVANGYGPNMPAAAANMVKMVYTFRYTVLQVLVS